MSLFILVWKSWTKTPFRPLMPQDPDGAFPGWPSLTRSDPALIDSITRPLYYITSPFTNLKQLRARLGLRPCQRGETLTRSSKRVKAEYDKTKKTKQPKRDRLNCWKCVWEDGESWRTGERRGRRGKMENRYAGGAGGWRLKDDVDGIWGLRWRWRLRDCGVA